MTATTKSFDQSSHQKIADVSRQAPLFFAFLFGSFLILGVGFIQSSTIHNAAHDVRHALAFPCH
jgi:cobalt transporter subunit CbtB